MFPLISYKRNVWIVPLSLYLKVKASIYILKFLLGFQIKIQDF